MARSGNAGSGLQAPQSPVKTRYAGHLATISPATLHGHED